MLEDEQIQLLDTMTCKRLFALPECTRILLHPMLRKIVSSVPM
jgi:hypothetical protein